MITTVTLFYGRQHRIEIGIKLFCQTKMQESAPPTQRVLCFNSISYLASSDLDFGLLLY